MNFHTRFGLVFCLILIPGLLFAQDAAKKQTTPAKLTAQEIAEKMDDTISGYDDQSMDVSWDIVDVDGSVKKYGLSVIQKGSKKRLIRFTSGEVKNMSILIDDRKMYVYLPGYRKVRRVAAHNMNQRFAGSDFTNDDMAAVRWSDDWDFSITKEDDANWIMRGDAKPGKDLNYHHIYITVGKAENRLQLAEYYNKKDEMVKRYELRDVKTFPGGARGASLVQMSDPRTGHKTILYVHSMEANQGLEDKKFTVRNLQWGR